MHSVKNLTSASYYTLYNMIVEEFNKLGYSVSDMADKNRLINLADQLGMEDLCKRLKDKNAVSNRRL